MSLPLSAVAVVTGAPDGIGREFAHRLTVAGLDLGDRPRQQHRPFLACVDRRGYALYKMAVAPFAREVDGGAALIVGCFGIGAVLEQQLGELQLTVLCGSVQGRHATLLAGVDIGTRSDQKARDVVIGSSQGGV